MDAKKIAVITRSNLVNVVSLMSAAQEHGESCRSYLARIQGLANVCKLSVKCILQQIVANKCPTQTILILGAINLFWCLPWPKVFPYY